MHQGAGQAVQPPVFIPIGELCGAALLGAQRLTRAKREEMAAAVAQTLRENAVYEPGPAVRAVVADMVRVFATSNREAFENVESDSDECVDAPAPPS